MPSWSSPNVYQYEPLSTSTAIRILALNPAMNFYQPLRYCLIEKDLSIVDRREVEANYEAISYAWGSQKRTRETFCDGKLMYVTPNCEVILRHLRLRNKVRTLWIDAICIDQGLDEHCLNEKSSQVQQMHRVYECASTVLVWLGVEHKDAKVVLNSMQKIGQLFQGCHLPWTVDRISRFAEAREKAFPLASELNDLINSNALEATTQVLWYSPWYYRIWTVQEVAFSRQCSVLVGIGHGYRALTWNEFASAAEVLCRINSLPRYPITAIRLKDDFKNYIAAGRFSNFEMLLTLENMRDWGASDAKDMIFALQSILLKCSKFKLVPEVDYRKPIDVIYKESATLYMQEIGYPYIFRLACTAGRTNVSSSWVPDFHNAFSRNQMWFPVRSNPLYAEGTSKYIKFTTDGNLQICGRIIDSAKTRGRRDFGPSNQEAEDVYDDLHRVITFQEWLQLFHSLKPEADSKQSTLYSTLQQSYSSWGAQKDIPRTYGAWEEAITSFTLPDMLLLEQGHRIKNLQDQQKAVKARLRWEIYLEMIQNPKELKRRIEEKVANYKSERHNKFEPSRDLVDGEREILELHHKLVRHCQNRALFSTESGSIGTSLFTVQEGDLVVEVKRWLELFIVRASGETFSLVGPTFIHGVSSYLTLEGPGIPEEHFSHVQGPCSNIRRDIRIV